MADAKESRGSGDGGPPPGDRQDIIRRALEKFEQLRRAPQADKALQDRVLSELGVDVSDEGEPGPKSSDAGGV